MTVLSGCPVLSLVPHGGIGLSGQAGEICRSVTPLTCREEAEVRVCRRRRSGVGRGGRFWQRWKGDGRPLDQQRLKNPIDYPIRYPWLRVLFPSLDGCWPETEGYMDFPQRSLCFGSGLQIQTENSWVFHRFAQKTMNRPSCFWCVWIGIYSGRVHTVDLV